MKESLIDLETAKIAKEKGFKESCFHYFSLEGEEKSFKEDIMYFYSKGENGRVILRPTQSLLQRWLREVHNLYVLVENNDLENEVIWYFYVNKKGGENLLLSTIKCKTYEEALELGLQEALKSLP